MLQSVDADLEALELCREACFEALGEAYESFFDEVSDPLEFTYPVISYPEKIKSIRLDKVPEIKGRLTGIKGQYLLFEDGSVLNVRNHAGYRVVIEW
jgi:hypothetical protein